MGRDTLDDARALRLSAVERGAFRLAAIDRGDNRLCMRPVFAPVWPSGRDLGGYRLAVVHRSASAASCVRPRQQPALAEFLLTALIQRYGTHPPGRIMPSTG